MKFILSIIAFSFVSNVSMAQCPVEVSDANKIIQAIESTDICYDAADIAEKCAWGSSVDIVIAGAAQKVCDVARPELSAENQTAYDSLVTHCWEKFKNEEGSMYRSASAFCALGVAKTFTSVFTPTGY